EMSSCIAQNDIVGEWIGLARFSAQGALWLREEMSALKNEGLLESADMPLLLTRLSRKHPVAIHYILAHWLDVDTLSDVGNAMNFI
ncbi:MAG TPA: phosphoenolpyruvate mutase, partial [Telmatospirillum sp.]|nr:phosphoenolpyruvate mutase [Telmatospirillum sp.]